MQTVKYECCFQQVSHQCSCFPPVPAFCEWGGGLSKSRCYPVSSTERGLSRKFCTKIWCRRKHGSSRKAVLSPGKWGLRTKVVLSLQACSEQIRAWCCLGSRLGTGQLWWARCWTGGAAGRWRLWLQAQPPAHHNSRGRSQLSMDNMPVHPRKLGACLGCMETSVVCALPTRV